MSSNPQKKGTNPMNDRPTDMIKRPDGSWIALSDLPDRQRLAHELVVTWFPKAEDENARLTALKQVCMREMRAFREMMLADYDVKIGGAEGGFSLKSVCGTKKIELSVNKQTTLGPELEAAKALIFEFLDKELEGSSAPIRAIVSKVFKLNTKGRLDTAGILGLREYGFKDELWARAMQAIDDAICRDNSTTYLRFYEVDTELKDEDMLPLNLAKV